MTALDDIRRAHDRERTRRLDAARARFNRWRTKHAARLAMMHPDVANEVRSLVETRTLAGIEGGLNDKDLHACKMRVASRIRVKQYGRCTEDEEAARQLRAVLAAMAEGGKREAA